MMDRYTRPATTPAEDDSQVQPALKKNWSPLLRALLTGLIVFLISAGLDWFLVHDRVPNHLIVDISDTIGAVVIAVLSFRLFQLQREREQAVFRRLETIAAMNHHIRNALQVISYTSTSPANEREVQAVRDAVARITWALREILPKV
jgi:hypothetical protein